MNRRAIALLMMLALAPSGLHAGGPLQVVRGAAVLWDTTQVIAYRIDSGPLGPIPESRAQAFAQDAFDTWTKVPTASVKLQAGRLDEDVMTATRFLNLTSAPENGSLVILDNAGAIVSGVYGQGQEQNILGLAAPRLVGGRFSRFIALMNGFDAENEATVRSTMVHEFGHALGLDHTQVNHVFANNDNKDDDQFLPTMFPTSTDDDSTLVQLNPDDMASISRLYPNAEYARTYGTIRGRLVRKDQRPVLGANVVANLLRDGKEDPMHRYSCVSDFLVQNDGSFDIAVIPGSYTLVAEPIRKGFAAGSSVGPYADDAGGLSFKNPIKRTVFKGLHAVQAGRATDVGTLIAQ
jgi:matrixin